MNIINLQSKIQQAKVANNRLQEVYVVDKEEKKQITTQIKNTEKAVKAMKIAMKSMNKFNSSFAQGKRVSE